MKIGMMTIQFENIGSDETGKRELLSEQGVRDDGTHASHSRDELATQAVSRKDMRTINLTRSL